MEKKELANELRTRQITRAEELVLAINNMSNKKITKQQFVDLVNCMSDDEIIFSYITCSECGKSMIPPDEDIISLAKNSKNADEWLSKLSCAR